MASQSREMPRLGHNLDLERCPHCSVDRPNLFHVHQFETSDYIGANRRFWRIYRCSRCGGVVTASSGALEQETLEIYPETRTVDESLPSRAKGYLQQAMNSLHAPAGAVMLAASAIDAMLKAKNYTDGSLYSRIDKAAEDHLITSEMAAWAHEVRLDANDQRHSDETATLPTADDAQRSIDFASALAQFLFVLPARVAHGRTK